MYKFIYTRIIYTHELYIGMYKCHEYVQVQEEENTITKKVSRNTSGPHPLNEGPHPLNDGPGAGKATNPFLEKKHTPKARAGK